MWYYYLYLLLIFRLCLFLLFYSLSLIFCLCFENNIINHGRIIDMNSHPKIRGYGNTMLHPNRQIYTDEWSLLPTCSWYARIGPIRSRAHPIQWRLWTLWSCPKSICSWRGVSKFATTTKSSHLIWKQTEQQKKKNVFNRNGFFSIGFIRIYGYWSVKENRHLTVLPFPS